MDSIKCKLWGRPPPLLEKKNCCSNHSLFSFLYYCQHCHYLLSLNSCTLQVTFFHKPIRPTNQPTDRQTDNCTFSAAFNPKTLRQEEKNLSQIFLSLNGKYQTAVSYSVSFPGYKVSLGEAYWTKWNTLSLLFTTVLNCIVKPRREYNRPASLIYCDSLNKKFPYYGSQPSLKYISIIMFFLC